MNKILIIGVLLLCQSCKAQNEIEYVEKFDSESTLRYHCVIAPAIEKGDANTYEILSWIDVTSPLLHLINELSDEQKSEFNSYINNSSGKDLVQINNKVESDVKSTFEICDIKSSSNELAITNCTNYFIDTKNQIKVKSQIDALTKDGMITRYNYQLTYKSKCEIKELSLELMELNADRKNIESEARSAVTVSYTHLTLPTIYSV